MLVLLSPARANLQKEVYLSFGSGFVLTILMIVSSEMRKVRTIIHEMKHAMVVILTGNKLGKIVANRDDGYVEYQLYKDKLHFAPIISLAPYFFPLFSLPSFIVSILMEYTSVVSSSLILGIALALDVGFGVGEIDPRQSDFKSMLGGYWLSKFYLIGFYLFWLALIFLWIRAGFVGIRKGMEVFGDLILTLLGV